MTGFSQAVLSRYIPVSLQVAHSQCKAHKHDVCRWVVTESGS
jgi:predicted hydrocarbon binding protein